MSKKIPNWTIHVIVWLVILGLHILTAYLVASEDHINLLFIEFPAVVCSFALFYLNYSFLVGRFWTKRKIGIFILLNLAALLVCIFILYECYLFIFERFGSFPELPDTFDIRMLAGAIVTTYIPGGLFVIMLSSISDLTHLF